MCIFGKWTTKHEEWKANTKIMVATKWIAIFYIPLLLILRHTIQRTWAKTVCWMVYELGDESRHKKKATKAYGASFSVLMTPQRRPQDRECHVTRNLSQWFCVYMYRLLCLHTKQSCIVWRNVHKHTTSYIGSNPAEKPTFWIVFM